MKKNKADADVISAALLIIAGVLVMLLPQNALGVVCIVCGVLIALMGALMVISNLILIAKRRGGGQRERAAKTISITIGGILTAVGILLIVYKTGFLRFGVAFFLLYGVLVFVLNIMSMQNTFKGPSYTFSILAVVVLAVLAVLVIVNPGFIAAHARIVQGCGLIINGLALALIKPTRE